MYKIITVLSLGGQECDPYHSAATWAIYKASGTWMLLSFTDYPYLIYHTAIEEVIKIY